jgi:hypothetical protein
MIEKIDIAIVPPALLASSILLVVLVVLATSTKITTILQVLSSRIVLSYIHSPTPAPLLHTTFIIKKRVKK